MGGVSNSGSDVFDGAYYLAKNPDVAAAGVDPLTHYMYTGWCEKRDPCELFDTSYYLEQNPDVAAAGVNPLTHYMATGWREGRDPGKAFDTSYYLDHNADIVAAGMNPLAHYISNGKAEGRRARDKFDIEIDYSTYDASGFFANHPERRAVVEEACDIWESIINDEFAALPSGKQISLLNPNTGAIENVTLTTPIDDLRIYLGSYSKSDTSLGLSRNFSTLNTGDANLDQRYNSYDNIEPWVGSIAFNENYSQYLYFDPTPGNAKDDSVPTNKYDFLHMVLHEIGHTLGMGPQNAGSQYVKTSNGVSYFAGPHVEAVYGGPVALDLKSGTHFATTANADALMKPSLNMGQRVLPTLLDKAFLADIGYEIIS